MFYTIRTYASRSTRFYLTLKRDFIIICGVTEEKLESTEID